METPNMIFTTRLSLIALLLLGAVLPGVSATPDTVDFEKFLARNDLIWTAAPKTWDEGPFLGNGFIGAYLYHDPKNPGWLRVELSRSDLYNRLSAVDSSGKLIECFRYASGHLYIKPKGNITNVAYRLTLHRAETTGTITTDQGELRFRAFVHAQEPLLRLELVGRAGEAKPVCVYEAERAVNPSRVRNKKTIRPTDIEPEPVVTTINDTVLSWQPFQDGGGAGTAVRTLVEGDVTTIVASLAVGWTDESPKAEVLRSVQQARPGDYDRSLAIHAQWWAKFYPASFLTLPDARLESFYWIQLYKMASATRANAPAIDLMGPWFASSGWCRYWNNLNIQLTYWPQLTSNHLELGESLMRMIERNKQNLINNAPAEWRHDSASIHGPAGPDMVTPMKTTDKGLECLTFMLHNVYWQYRYSMDERLLREVLYPLLTRSLNYYRHKLVTLEDGNYHLPMGYSSEYGVAEDINQDLSAIRWSAQTLLAAAARLKIDDPLIPAWKDLLAKLTPYPVDEKTGFMIGKNMAQERSHRHWSHLFMIFPYGLLDLNGPDRPLIEKSIKHFMSSTSGHAGFTYTGTAIMAAYLGDGDQALARLNTLMTPRYVRPNTMYGEAGGSPVIETPLSGARSIHEMVLQSWGDTIRVFPAIPKIWTELAFRDLRAEGAFLVTAKCKAGKTVYVRIESLAGEPCKILTGIADYDFRSSRPMEPKSLAAGAVSLPLSKGDWAEFRAKGETDFTIAPVARTGPDNAWGTVKK
jgi:hypothetical protein